MLELRDHVADKSNQVIARRRPGNKGRRYPADPPRVEEIVAVMRQAGTDPYGRRLRGLIIVLWRAGLRISEALALTESDLEVTRGSVLVRRGKGGRRREVGMDEWAWDQLRPWLEARVSFPVGPLLRDQRDQLAVGPGQAHRCALGSDAPRPGLGYGGASSHTSCATPTPSKWRERASRSTSSSASWDMPTSGSPRSTCRASTAARSSKMSALAVLR